MISFGGLASGLDTQAIISALVNVEKLPIQQLEQQKATANKKLELIGTLKGHLKALQSAADGMKTVADFLGFKVTPSVDNVATFTSTGEAEPGSHTLEVLSLAQADRWAFDGVADPNVDLAGADGQSVDFTVNGTSYSIAVTQTGSSLNEIAGAINDLAGDDVTASVVNVGTDASPSWQLVLSSDSTGEDGRITGIGSSIAGLVIADDVGQTISANHITVGSNAVALIDGLHVERADNDFNGVIPGIDITVLSDDLGQEISFTVEADTQAVKDQLQKFVDAYNEVIKFANQQNAYTEDGGAGGALFGDSILRSVRSSLTSALFGVNLSAVQGDTLGYSSLGIVGIKTQNDGTLLIDSSTLDAKISENIDALADLFVDSDGFDNGGAAQGTPGYYVDTSADSGLAEKLSRAIDLMFGTLTGPGGASVKALFDAREESINKKIDTLNDSIDAKQRYLDIFEQQLIQRFSALEELMGGLNSQGNALTGALASLNNNNN
ncbi:MAG: flagellar filament capping protein FliD [Planctomycetes bacterium]|nr:flagellar filament capping protein FliD [Planctomycetota bacterium]